MMLNSLELVQHGQMCPENFQSTVTYNRMSSLELSKHSELEQFHQFGVTAIDLEKQRERFIISGGKNGDLAIHDLFNSTGDPSYYARIVSSVKSSHRQYAHKNLITTALWYPFDTGAFTTSSMDHQLKIWDTERMKPVDSFSMEFKINAHSMSPKATQRNLIAVGMKSPHVILVDPRSGERCHELRAHRVGVSSLKWSPLCEYLLASGGCDNKIFLWDIRSARGCLVSLDQYNDESNVSTSEQKTAHDGNVNALNFTPNGLHLVSHGMDSKLRLWDVASGKNSLVNYGSLSMCQTGYPFVMDMCFNNNLSIVFVPCDNHVCTYDLFNGVMIQKLTGHFGHVTGCVYRSSTHELYSAGIDYNILVWTSDKYPRTLRRPPVEDDSWSD